MTTETLEQANNLQHLIRSAQYLITNNCVEPGNFNYLYHNDKDFCKEFRELRDKYYNIYTKKFQEL